MSQIFPTFNIDPSTVKDTVSSYINRIQEMETLEKKMEPSWKMFDKSAKLEKELSRYLTEIGHLTSVTNNKDLEDAYESIIPLLSKYYAESGQDSEMLNCIKGILKTQELDSVQNRILNRIIDSFKLSGLELCEDDKITLNEYNEKLSTLSNEFSKNSKKSRDAWEKNVLSKCDLVGIQDVDMQRFKSQAEEKNLEGYLITLQFPDIIAVLTYSEEEFLRKEVYMAMNTVASKYANDGEFDNSKIMDEILSLRHKKSELLGFNNYSELSLQRKMANSPEEVVSFLNDLSEKSKGKAAQENEEMLKFAKEDLEINVPKHWDLTLISRKHKEKKHNIDLSKIKEYFPKTKVENGLYWLIEELFDVKIKKVESPHSYHKDVELLKLSRDNKDIAYIYTDIYSRPGKRGGAWMNDYEGKTEDSLPVAFVTCNFPAPSGEEEALLSFGDVTTLFHEFGHALHHTLTTVEYSELAGISGVPWDAVELPSTFMEFFCIQPEVLTKISGHYETNEPLPMAMIKNMKDAEQYYSANGLLRQMDLSLSDMLIHMGEGLNINKVSASFKEENELRPSLDGTATYNDFGHIFAGGYAAGYYSYKWADILSSDIFESFEECGVLNKELAKKYLDEILSKGGSDEMSTLFENFKGRSPSPDAFLKYQGVLNK